MHRTLFLLIPALLLLAGCATPDMGRQEVQQRDVYYATRGTKLHFLLVTDNTANWDLSVRDNIILGPRYIGRFTSKDASYGGVNFEATRSTLTIGPNHYNFANGRIFVASAAGGRLKISQFDLPPAREAELIAASDPRIHQFFIQN